MSNLTSSTLAETRDLLRKKEITSEELTRAYLDAIAKKNETLNCFVHVCEDLALERAKETDALRATGNDKPLLGLPFALKDIFLTEGIPTSCASKMLKNYTATYTGTVVKKLRDAGTVLLGKLNMDEFAMGSTNEHSVFGAVKNPWNVDYIPGGSSGGSAVATSADLCAASLGTDTGGSIRQPASMCGVVGIKPTYGRVSRYGVIAFASSLDQVGPLTKDVRDAALVLEAIAGHDENDATSLNLPVPEYSKVLGKDIAGKKVGIPKEYFIDGIDKDVKNCVHAALKQLEYLGAELVEISLPHTEYAVPTYYILAPAEASSNLARYDGVRYGYRHDAKDLNDLYNLSRSEGFGDEVKLRILLGTFVLSSGYYDAYYLRAQKVRQLIKQDFDNVFKKVDVIVSPVAPTAAFKFNEKVEDPVQMYLNDILTIPTSLAGLPGMSVPCGFTSEGLPVGMQIIGKALDEETLFQVAYAYEQSSEWRLKKPSTT